MAISIGDAYRSWACDDTFEVKAKFNCAGTTLDMVKVLGEGVNTVARTADGKFTITFAPGHFGAAILDADVKVHSVAGTAALVAAVSMATYNSTNGTLAFEVWDLATPSLAIPASTAVCTISVMFTRTPT